MRQANGASTQAPGESRPKRALRYVLGASLVLVGIAHFTAAEDFVAIVPPFLPAPLALVYVSGVFEILGGIGLQVPRTRRFSAWGLIALFIAVYPANIYMLVEGVGFGGLPPDPLLLWLRMPLQFVFIAWAWWYTRGAE
jgi:uncharacterized membrane protein